MMGIYGLRFTQLLQHSMKMKNDMDTGQIRFKPIF